jgi:hypothetical protein
MNMRSPLFFTLALLGLSACQNDPTQSEQYKQLLQDRELQMEQNQEKEATIDELFGSFNRISDNIRAIREKQGGLSVESLDVENGEDMETRIMGDLKSIDDLMNENKKLIADLRKSSKGKNLQISSLEKTISSLEALVADKDAEISSLKEQLSSANSSLAVLIEMYREKSQMLENKEVEQNTAYYAFGTAKELKENGIIEKVGGVGGVGGAKSINMSGLNEDYFQKIDISEVQTIPIMAKKAKLITSHPDGSYVFEGEVDRIKITDPEAFWSVSKYLVVQVN